MQLSVPIEEWNQLSDIPIMDVRSPGEYTQGHMVDAHSIPLFSNEERAIIGTLYKQTGREEAMHKALEMVGPHMIGLVEAAKGIAPGKKIKVHCWRGGMRSGSVAWLLNTMGFQEVFTLQGGYKSYRKWILSLYEKDYPLLILGGRTGSAKTEVLKALKQMNESVIDLEAIAHHKGSAFGWIGESEQPSQEQFENNLGEQLFSLRNVENFWLEDESISIGKNRIPIQLFEKLRSATVYFLDIPVEIRIPHLVNTYAAYGDEKLAQSIMKIHKRLGGMNTKLALEGLAKKDYELVARLALKYYDKSYEAGINHRVPNSVVRIHSKTIDPIKNAALILNHKLKNKHGAYQTHTI